MDNQLETKTQVGASIAPVVESTTITSTLSPSTYIDQLSRTYSFINPFTINKALDDNDWSSESEVKELVDIIKDPETKTLFKLRAMCQLRELVTTALNLSGALPSIKQSMKKKTDAEGNEEVEVEQTLTSNALIQQMRSSQMLERNEAEKEFRNQLSLNQKPVEGVEDGKSDIKPETTGGGSVPVGSEPEPYTLQSSRHSNNIETRTSTSPINPAGNKATGLSALQ